MLKAGRMKNLGRALRMALRYRISIVGSVICSAFVALLWGANLGAVYPFIEVVMRNQSLHEWADARISESQTMIVDAEKRIEQLKDDAQNQDDAVKSKKTIRSLTTDIEQHQDRIAYTEKLVPWLNKYAPTDPFRTLIYIVGFCLLYTSPSPRDGLLSRMPSSA